ncbi:MAG TPA: hypothetical protein VGL35_15235 [Rhizomicrobium sp.]|jgi:hypothetical protein
MDQRVPRKTPTDDKLQDVPATRVRQGVASGRIRYVLGIGLALVIAAFAIIWFLNFSF